VESHPLFSGILTTSPKDQAGSGSILQLRSSPNGCFSTGPKSRYSFFGFNPAVKMEEAWCIISAAWKINIVSTHGHLEKIMKKNGHDHPGVPTCQQFNK
jgi:hypothetical protein